MRSKRRRLLAIVSLIFLAVSIALPPLMSTWTKQTSAEVKSTSTPAPTIVEARQIITVSISIYILDDENGELSSTRNAKQLEEIFVDVNNIWTQADIIMDVQAINRVEMSSTVLEALAKGDFQTFFYSANKTDFPNASLINAFYAQDIGGSNGIAPVGSDVFFVMDFPSVHHERVSSHEIGHILGLHHTLTDTNRLMYPGTNGMTLTEEEIIVARYGAQGLLAGVR